MFVYLTEFSLALSKFDTIKMLPEKDGNLGDSFNLNFYALVNIYVSTLATKH